MDDFPRRSGKSSHLRNHKCKSCWALNMKAWRYKNPEKEKASRDAWKANNPDRIKYLRRKNAFSRKYGLSIEKWDELFASQNGQCKICESVNVDLVVDHCHKTGRVRMLLCNKCNRGLGCFNDDPKLMKKAAEVIRAFMESEYRE